MHLLSGSGTLCRDKATRRRFLSASALGIFVCILLALPSFAFAQSARVSGLVTDPSGAPVADTSVRITNLATKEVYNVRTDTEGNYQVQGLAAGEYDIDVQVSGFKAVQLRGIEVGASAAVTQDVRLELENASQSVNVRALPSDLKTQPAALTGLVEGVKSQDIVFTARDIEALHPNTVLDVLQTVPGMEVDYQGRQYPNSVTLRGGAVLVVIDGVYLTQVARQLALFPVQLIESMTIVRNATALSIGPLMSFEASVSSTGSSNVGIQGFIVIKTRRSSSPEAGFVSSGGNWETAMGHAYTGSRSGNWDYRVAYTYYTTQGAPSASWTMGARNGTMTFHGGYTSDKLNVEFLYLGSRGYRDDESPIYVAPHWTGTAYDWSVVNTPAPASGYFNPDDMDLYNLNVSRPWNANNRTVLQYGFYNSHILSPTLSYGSQDNTEANLDLQHTYCFSGNCVTGGGQAIKFIAPNGIAPRANAKSKTGVAEDRVDDALYSWYVQDEFKVPGKRLDFDAGIRGDKLHHGWPLGGTSKIDVWVPTFYTFTAGAIYQATDKLSLGTRYGFVQSQPPSGYVTVSGAQLAAQSQQRAEISADYKISRHLEINLAPYGYNTSNAFTQATGCPGFPAGSYVLNNAAGNPIAYCVNPAGNIWTYGIDSSVSGIVYGPLKYNTGYGYVEENNTVNNIGITHHFVHGQLDFRKKIYFADFNMIYVGPRWYTTPLTGNMPALPGYFPYYPFSNYTNLNANAGANFKLFGRAMTFTASSYNMGDGHYMTNTSAGGGFTNDFGAFPNPGRNYTFQLATQIIPHDR
ncbi:TonB-dependent receptor [Paracidobacterium acidisoli]|uniref:TonB-dependent receptor n=1 Tax=Paracidobacterium acidisoli TaxID=2303751 RepID=A0A372IQB7_9BACT|nr:TonB-dependent receptor [Paracidobacterium acidisoli]MBT9331518.1 TonB-dependent receptor [Paracidobacterium acidisoli]